jgi:2-keto-4-pentenoate hydratase
VTSPHNAAALTRREHSRLADVLLRAAGSRTAIAPLSASYPELTVADATRIRDTAIVRRIESGARIVGAKVSLGHTAEGPDGLGDQPLPRLGWLTDDMLLGSASLDLSGLRRPRLEAKVAFALTTRLRSRVASVTELLQLTGRVVPCLEILDEHYETPAVELVDDIADNCAAAGLLTGSVVATPAEDDLLAVRVRIDCDRATETFVPPLSPVRATLWLANRVIEEGGELDPGALLVSSACCPVVELEPGMQIRADFGALGQLELTALST